MDDKTVELPHYMDDESRLFNSLTEEELDELGEVLCMGLELELQRKFEERIKV